MSAFAVVGAGIILASLKPIVTHGKAEPSKVVAGQDRPWAYWLLFSIHIADDLVRTGFLIFLPFLLRNKGADLPTIGLGLSLLFAGGAAGKLVMGWVGQKLGVVPSVLLTEIATTLLILAALPLSLDFALLLLPAVGLMLNGTSSVLYGTIPEFVSPEQRTQGLRRLLHRRIRRRRDRSAAVRPAGRCGRPHDGARCRILRRAHHRADGLGLAAGLRRRLKLTGSRRLATRLRKGLEQPVHFERCQVPAADDRQCAPPGGRRRWVPESIARPQSLAVAAPFEIHVSLGDQEQGRTASPRRTIYSPGP